jgi:polyphosphate kinase 2 (PPK2 family)
LNLSKPNPREIFMPGVRMLEIIDLSQKLSKKRYTARINEYQTQLRALGYQIYAQQRPVIMIFEGWDAAGKGGAIKRITERLDPRGYRVHPIAAPAGDDAEKHYLYRFWRRLPITGETAIFDRSWYGRVLVERIEGFCTEAEWRRAYQEINDFERQLVDFGAIIFKFWFHISQEEQLARFQAREQEAHKQWKLTPEDWRNREKWEQYEEAVEDMLIKTTTAAAPWTIIPANDKYFARVETIKTIVRKLIRELNFDPTPENLANLPSVAAITPVPQWALEKAERLGAQG